MQQLKPFRNYYNNERYLKSALVTRAWIRFLNFQLTHSLSDTFLTLPLTVLWLKFVVFQNGYPCCGQISVWTFPWFCCSNDRDLVTRGKECTSCSPRTKPLQHSCRLEDIPTCKTTGEGKKSCRRGSESLNQKKTNFFHVQFENGSLESFKSLAQDRISTVPPAATSAYQRNKLDCFEIGSWQIYVGSYSSLFSFLLLQSLGNFFSTLLGTEAGLSSPSFPGALRVPFPFLVVLAPHLLWTTSSQTTTSTDDRHPKKSPVVPVSGFLNAVNIPWPALCLPWVEEF